MSLITCRGPRTCSQNSAVLLSHFVAKYYSSLAYTWTRLKINPLAPGSVLNRHGIECGPKLIKAAGHKWSFRTNMTHSTHAQSNNAHTSHTHTHTHTSRTDVVRISVGFGFLQKVRRKVLQKGGHSLKRPSGLLMYQFTSHDT